MFRSSQFVGAALVAAVAVSAAFAVPVEHADGGDRVVLKDGTVLTGVYVRDEGVRYTVWDSFDEVGGPIARTIPYDDVKEAKLRRGDEWDRQPDLPDLSITCIEQNPKLPGLHGQIHYDQYGAATIRPRNPEAARMVHVGQDAVIRPEAVVAPMKFKREIGDRVTLTAHVRNVGFTAAEPFEVVWSIDGEEVHREKRTASLEEMEVATFDYTYEWAKDHPYVTVRLETGQDEIATINNELTDPMWGFAYTFIVSKPRAWAWHEHRSAYGTFSFDDFYQWHVQIMNLLFEHSRYPAVPEGPRARVRLDRILYVDNPAQAQEDLFRDDGIRYDQGGWTWNDSPEELKSKQVAPPSHEWRNQTEWSLPHELGHQLGLIDWYNFDTQGIEGHPCSWPDNGKYVSHFQDMPYQMMHWHGPQLFGEVDAAYLDMTWDKPRGYFGDHVWAIPAECFLRVIDVNGDAVAGARVEVFQRGVQIDKDGPVDVQQGVKFRPVIEDGNFGVPMPPEPVIMGETDNDGVLRLPNRPTTPCKTLNGFRRQPNPFGNMNVVGQRGVMFVKVTKPDGSSPQFFSIDLFNYNVAWFRGQKKDFTQVLQTPWGPAAGGPPAPRSVAAKYTADDKQQVRVTWAPAEERPRHYLDDVVAYKIYRRVSDDCLNDKPWFCVATVNPQQREAVVDLAATLPDEVYWFGRTERFAVSAVGRNGTEGELITVVLPQQ